MKEDFTKAVEAANIIKYFTMRSSYLLSAYNVLDAFPIQHHVATLTNWVEIIWWRNLVTKSQS